MESITTPFNPIQLELLKLFATGVSEEELQALKQILVDFKFRRVTEMAEIIRREKNWTASDVEALTKQHERTPYKSKATNMKRQSKN
jgi:hypothetical protein